MVINPYDWPAVGIALLIALALVGGLFVLQALNGWVMKFRARSHRRALLPSSTEDWDAENRGRTYRA